MASSNYQQAYGGEGTPMPPDPRTRIPDGSEVPASTPVSREEPIVHHVHSSYIWLGSLGSAIGFLFVILVMFSSSIGSLVSGIGEEAFEAFVVIILTGILLVVIVVITVVARLLTYKHLYYTIGDSEFNLYSGIFNKKRVHVPYTRIQSVDQRATLLQRIFGVCSVSIDTAGGAANKAVLIPYLTKQRADELRAELFERKRVAEGMAPGFSAQPLAQNIPAPTQEGGNVLDMGKAAWDDFGGVFAGSYQDELRATYEYGLSNKELLLAGLSNSTAFSAIVVGFIAVVFQILTMFVDILPDQADDLYNGLTATDPSMLFSGVSLVIVVSVIGIMVFVWALSGVASCVNYGGFRARRRGERIEVEHGLLQHTLQGVDVDRVQSVVIKQTFIRRLMGYCELTLSKVDAAADPTDANQKNQRAQQGIVIHPFVKLDRINDILTGIIPEYRDVPQSPIKLSPKALRRGIVRRAVWQGGGFWLAVCVALIQILINVVILLDAATDPVEAAEILAFCNLAFLLGYALALVLFVIDIIGAVLWARGSSFAYNERFMQVTNGGFSRQTVNFPRQKIQFGFTKTNPLQRLARTATICARTAAGVGGTNIALIDVTEADADQWLRWVEPYGNQRR